MSESEYVHDVLSKIVTAIDEGFETLYDPDCPGVQFSPDVWRCKDCSALVYSKYDPDDPTWGAREEHLHWHLSLFYHLKNAAKGKAPLEYWRTDDWFPDWLQGSDGSPT